MSRRKQFKEVHDHQTAMVFLDLTILPFYRISKILASKTPFKESVKETRGHFFFDVCCACLMLYVCGWLGTWQLLGKQWYEMWITGAVAIGVMALCLYIGRWRRNPHIPKLTISQRISNEEQREDEQYEEQHEEYVQVPPVKFTATKRKRAKFVRKPTEADTTAESNYNEVLAGLSNLGYNSHEAKSGADFAEANVPDGNTAAKIIESLRYFNQAEVS